MASIDAEEVFLTGKDREDAEALLGVPTVGYIPLIEEPGLRLIRDVHSFSPLMESFRSLRVNLQFLAEPSLHSFAVFSSVPAEGKSTAIANLAMAIALKREKNRVIIVDADLRRPAQHTLFSVDPIPGLVDVLRGTHTLEQALRPTSVPGIQVIPAGTPPLDPTELLESEAMGRLLTELKSCCDLALVDAPPALAVADALVVASRVDGAVLLISNGETSKAKVVRAMQLLARARVHVLGTVFNRVGGVNARFYYGSYYVPLNPAPKDAAE